jgi:ATP-dependent Lon protease
METGSSDQVGGRRLPILPLRDVVVYPHMVIPLFVGRDKSVVALDQAMAAGKEILLVAQTHADVDDPSAEDLYSIGTVATILQLLKLPDGTVKVLVEGLRRARLSNLQAEECFTAEVEDLPEATTTIRARWTCSRARSCRASSNTSSSTRRFRPRF